MADTIEMLSRWARLAPQTAEPARRPSSLDPISFDAAFSGLIESSTTLRNSQSEELNAALIRSKQKLPIFGEPLTKELGLARFLANEREEAYSHWLQWAFSCMTVSELASVLNLPHLVEHCRAEQNCKLSVQREVPVSYGHEGRSGKLDLLVEIGESAIIAIEVKLGPPANTEKHKGYKKSLEEHPEFARKTKFYILIVTGADSDNVHGFDVRRYAVLCRNFRRLAQKWIVSGCRASGGGPIEAALLLAVCAAIEKNLLRLSVGKETWTAASIAYLQKFVERAAYE